MGAQKIKQDAGHENRGETEPAECVRIDEPVRNRFRFSGRLEMIQYAGKFHKEHEIFE